MSVDRYMDEKKKLYIHTQQKKVSLKPEESPVKMNSKGIFLSEVSLSKQTNTAPFPYSKMCLKWPTLTKGGQTGIFQG